MNAVTQLAFELALRNEIDNNWRSYRKVPNRVQIMAANQADPKTLPEALHTMAIAAYNPLGIDLEGKNYRWTEAEGLIISKSKPVIKVEVVEEDRLWWD